MAYGESNGYVTYDQWCHMTPKGQTRDHNTLRAQYNWRCYLATIANYYIVCYEADYVVGYVVLATAWRLVLISGQRHSKPLWEAKLSIGHAFILVGKLLCWNCLSAVVATICIKGVATVRHNACESDGVLMFINK